MPLVTGPLPQRGDCVSGGIDTCVINRSTASRFPRIIPFQEPVTFYHRTGGDSFTSYSVGCARRKKVYRQDARFSQELLVTADLVWQITSDQLAVTPATDDYLVDGSNVGWQLVEVVAQMNGTVFNCLARRRV